MNQIEVQQVNKNENWTEFEWFIDGIKLSQYLDKNKCPNVESFNELCPAWIKSLDFYGDVRFIWKLINQEKAVVPIYMCPEDLDFSCIVIVVEVEKKEDFVYWKRVGRVNYDNYDFYEERLHGILDLESYTDDDWEKYGDNVALSKVCSNEWSNWISENWDEELLRRRINYTMPYLEDENNIIWFANLDFSFARNQYEQMVNGVWQDETMNEL